MAENMLKWVTVSKGAGKNKDDMDVDIPDKVLAGGGEGKSAGGGKRLSVERLYQKKSQLEHILLRPDSYIGSVETVTQPMWVYSEADEVMVQREITFVPGLYKIFDEILVNAADNKQRDKNMNCIKIDIDPESGKIKIWNNGRGIPVVEHKTEKMYVPTMIFGHLLTSSNFDDTQKKVTGGRNGYGAKLCNIFSTKFVVETQSNKERKAFKQTWTNNMGNAGEPKIVAAKGDDYTCITFCPDLGKFKMARLDQDVVELFTRRAYDIAASLKGVKVFLNGKKLPVKNFKDYVEIYTKGKVDELGAPLKVAHEVVSDRWEVAITLSEKGFQQVSFVNSIATTKGGRHVDHVTDHLVSKIIEMVKKKEKKGGITIKPFQVKNHVWVFVNCLIENPTFDSQTKENMTLQAKSFGSKCTFQDKFINQVSKCGIIESIMSWMKFKQQAQLNKKMSSGKTSKLKGIPKLDDANNAGTKNSMECTLILTEGDSAKTLAVAGLGVIGRDRYGVFPLKGKVLNVREATHKQIMENAETNNLIKIMGLKYKEKYETPDTLRMLRYGKIMIMTDQDQDGSHIKGLLINFIHHNWPNLLKHEFLEEFITPIVKVTKKKDAKCFYSLPEFEEWKKETDNWHTYKVKYYKGDNWYTFKVKYYKGLGTSTSKEAKEYFSDMQRHRIPFKYAGTEDDASIVLAFSKKKIEERKEWLTNWMEERKRRAQLGLPELFLYGKETRNITYNEFVNRELILFSNMDNERSIPSVVDGFKPGQRKVFFTCLKRNVTKEMKVAQLAGSVAEHSAYHHGENSLMSTIINLAQNFVGSNNINILQPIGQFGTRLHGGKDAASPRYIFTSLSPLARHLFNANDDAILKSNFDDNQRIEPEWYIPIIPMVLVNGAQGIGTGWSTNIPNYAPREIVNNILRMLDGNDPLPMLPAFKNFVGTIEQIDETRCVSTGEVSIIDDQNIEVTELPIRTWTQVYKENVLEPMLQGTDKTTAFISNYKEYHTDTTVRFVVTMNADKLAFAEDQGLHKVFKLQTSMSTASMVLFDSNGCIRRYSTVEEILKEFFELRMDYYRRRKDYMEGMLAADSLRLDNIARFICEKIDGIIIIENKMKKDIVQNLVRRGYDPDPVKVWKDTQNKLQALDQGDEVDDEDDDSQSTVSGSSGRPNFQYLLTLPILSLTKEKKEELLKQRDAKAEELYQLRKKSPEDLWKFDLKAFSAELDEVERHEREEEAAGLAGLKAKAAKGGKGRMAKILKHETKPSPMGRRVEPRIDPSLRAKSEAAARKKTKLKEKKELGLDDDVLTNDGDELTSLADRLGMKSSAMTKKQTTIKDAFSKVPKPQKAEVAKKLDIISDSESDFEDARSKSNNSSQSSASPSIKMDLSPSGPKKERNKKTSGPKRTAGKIYDSDMSDLSETDYKKTSPKKARKPFDSDSEDESSPAKKGTQKRVHGSSDDDFELDDEFKLKVQPTAREGRARKTVKYNFGSEDDDGDNDVGADEPPSPFRDEPKEQNNFDDLDDDDDMPQLSPPPKQNTDDIFNNSSKIDDDSDFNAKSDDSDDDGDDDGDIWGAKKPAPKKAAAPKADKPPPKKRAPKAENGAEKPKKAPRKKAADGDKPKRAPAKKSTAKKMATFTDSEEDEFAPKSKAKKAKKVSDSDSDFGEFDDVAPKSRGRATAPKKYNFGDSDSDDFDDY